MKPTRINRLLQLIGLLQAGRHHNVNSLATECGVSRRQIFRDLELLKQSSVPLKFDEPSGCYHLTGNYYLPPTNFTTEEALAMIVVCHELGSNGTLPFLSPARDAALKLESSLPGKLREEFRNLTEAIHIRFPPSTEQTEQGPTYHTLLEAIGQRRCVRIHYDSFTERNPIVTKLSPYRLLFSRHSWYVIGRSSIHAEVRTFNVARVKKLEWTEDHFKIPKNFELDRYLGNAWHLIPEPGRDQDVLIRFQPLVARNVAEVNWHRTQRCEMNADGSLDFHVRVSGLNEISWWILGYGDQAEVLKPKALRTRIADAALRLSQVYHTTE